MTASTGSGRRHYRRPILVVLGLAIFFTALPSFQDGAFAQEVIRRRTLFDALFGPRRRAEPPPPAQPQRAAPPPAARQQQQPARRAAPAAPPAPPPATKLENARVVLVVGDFLASGMAEGLQAAYADSPGVRIVDRTNGSSGFVRDDFYDWNAAIGPILEEVEPAVVVVMIGSNDRQPLVVGGEPERPQSEPWLQEYESRLTRFAEAVQAANIPLVWTGLPPFRSSAMSSDMLAFNDIHKQAAEAVGGTFVDIWEGFVDENGAFVFTGPDMYGQPVRLRGNDGINMTRAGKRKVAFYVEQPLNKLLGPAAEPDVEEADIEGLPLPELAAGTPADTSRTGPISLNGPDIDGSSELLGSAAGPGTTSTERFAPVGRPGRADDFSRR